MARKKERPNPDFPAEQRPAEDQGQQEDPGRIAEGPQPVEQSPATEQPHETQQQGGQAKRPAYKTRIGRLHCDVWENQHAEQGPWYSVAITRHYRDTSGEWKTSTSFGRDDLLVVAELARMAFHWIAVRQQNGS